MNITEAQTTRAMVTFNQIKRVADHYASLVKEPVEVEVIDNTLYVFGSELAMLRLHYRMQTGRVEYSKNLQTWFFAMEIKID